MFYSKNFKHISYVLFFSIIGLFAFTGCTDNPVQNQNRGTEVSAVDNGHHAAAKPQVSNGNSEAANATADKNIVEIASSNSDFSILVKAVKFAGLADDLSGKRQFTVFAPTNAAFEDLLQKLGLSAEQLFTEENKPLVKSILLYHVVPGERFAEVVLDSDRLNTLQKEFLMVKIMNGNPMIGNDDNGYANIATTDIDASNGVIHVVDQVLLQPSY